MEFTSTAGVARDVLLSRGNQKKVDTKTSTETFVKGRY